MHKGAQPLPSQVVLPGSLSSHLMDLDAFRNGALLFELRTLPDGQTPQAQLPTGGWRQAPRQGAVVKSGVRWVGSGWVGLPGTGLIGSLGIRGQ